MIDWRTLLLSPDDAVHRALELIDRAGSQFVLIVDDECRLLGVVTDGDMRRSLIAGRTMEDKLHAVMHAAPVTVPPNTQANAVLDILLDKDFTHLPVVDENGAIIALWSRKSLQARSPLHSPVVFMAGGLGSRLGELTRHCPKPLLKVGGRPILEIALESFREAGFRNFFIAVNYHARMIEEHFGDGSRQNVCITYLREKKRLGTAGALSLLPAAEDPVIVMNGDILTRLNPRLLLEQHAMNKCAATMVTKQHEVTVPYGVVHTAPGGELDRMEEKPVLSFAVSAGINVFSPQALKCIPPDARFDIPDLYAVLKSKGMTAKTYMIHDYWLDIGRLDDYRKADADVREIF